MSLNDEEVHFMNVMHETLPFRWPPVMHSVRCTLGMDIIDLHMYILPAVLIATVGHNFLLVRIKLHPMYEKVNIGCEHYSIIPAVELNSKN